MFNIQFNYIYSLAAIVILIFLSGAGYYLYTSKKAFDNFITSQNQSVADDASIYINRVEHFPFYLEDASAEYKTLHTNYQNYKEQTYAKGAREFFAKDKTKIIQLYRDLLSFYNNKNFKAKERAYAINMMNSVYITDFDSATFAEAIFTDSELFAIYRKNLDFITQQKKKATDEAKPSAFMGSGNAGQNFSVHMTLNYIDWQAYKLYPNAYSLVRSNLNLVQADLIQYNNYVTQYKDYQDLLTRKYGLSSLRKIENDLDNFRKNEVLYADLFSAAYEIDIATFNGVLWPQLNILKGDKTQLKEKTRLATKILIDTDHMLQVLEENKTVPFVYNAQLHSAVNKTAIARTRIFTKVQSDVILDSAQKVILTMFNTNKTQESLKFTIKNLQKGSLAERELTYLGSINPEINTFLTNYRN